MAREQDYFARRRRDGVWVVRRKGASRACSTFSTEMEAWKETRRLARGVGSRAELLNQDGSVKTSTVYVDNLELVTE